MKDINFDEIGKRLYDQEADPPGNGWERVRADITFPKPGSKTPWTKANLWKPLPLMIPLALYLFLLRTPVQDAGLPPAVSGENVSGKTENEVAEVSKDALQSATIQSQPLPSRTREEKQLVATEAVTKAEANKGSDVLAAHLRIGEDPSIEEPLRPGNSIKFPISDDAHQAVGADEPNPEQSTSVIHTWGRDIVANAGIAATLADKEEIPFKHDSLKTTARDPDPSKEIEEPQQKVQSGHWRIAASFTPQYVGQSARPIRDDEVFVTNIEDQRTKLSEKIGLGFSVGVGKLVARKLYIDAHLSFSTTGQNTSYSYSTGNVDTLLALQQPDQTIRIIPVYQLSDQEFSSKHTYGGIRLAATYYSLSTPQGRFNITGGAGIHYLLSSTVKAKADGKWITFDDDDLNKVNYTLMAGAGYSRQLNNRWELMISPTLTYHLRQVKNDHLPYRLNQNPLGLNVMLSRTFGKM